MHTVCRGGVPGGRPILVNIPDKFLQEANRNTERGTQFYGWTQSKDRAIVEEKEKAVGGP